MDAEHFTERLENFFIIILGEGVLLLIKGSPLGGGFSQRLNGGVLTLVVLYCLAILYFNGDQTRRYTL